MSVCRTVFVSFAATTTAANFGDEFEKVKKDMIIIGELATLAMEIQIQQRTSMPVSMRPEHSVSSMNLKTIQKTLVNFNADHSTPEQGSTKTNAVDAANRFVAQWNSSNETKTGPPGSVITVGNGDAELDSLTFVPEEDVEEDLEVKEQEEIAELLDEWEGAEDRLERKKVRQNISEVRVRGKIANKKI